MSELSLLKSTSTDDASDLSIRKQVADNKKQETVPVDLEWREILTYLHQGGWVGRLKRGSVRLREKGNIIVCESETAGTRNLLNSTQQKAKAEITSYPNRCRSQRQQPAIRMQRVTKPNPSASVPKSEPKGVK
eukprot:scaffold133473_cov53-Attheya_sp.AAC.3